MEKFMQNLDEAGRIIRTVDHLIYVTFPLVKDKKMLLKMLTEMNLAVTKILNAILQYDYIFKRISLYQDAKANFRTFEDKCAFRYGITKEQISLIKELFELNENHKTSAVEFMKDSEVTILSDGFVQKKISAEKIKEFVLLAKDLMFKSRERMRAFGD